MSIEKKLVSSSSKPFLLEARDVFSGVVGYSQLKVMGDDLYYLESRPEEAGRRVLMKRMNDGSVRQLTKEGFSLRTRVHEYGGGAYCISKKAVYFVNDFDGQIYRQSLNDWNDVLKVTDLPKETIMAGLEVDSEDRFLLAISERKQNGNEAKNEIVAFILDSSLVSSRMQILFSGNDFYGVPHLSKSSSKLAFLTWNHPNMPWDSTQLWLYDVDFESGEVVCQNGQLIAGGSKVSVCQVRWGAGERLFFVQDFSGYDENSVKNWWNLFSFKDGHLKEETAQLKEFGYPDWVFGLQYLAVNEEIDDCYVRDKVDIYRLDRKKGSLQNIASNHRFLENLTVDNKGVLYFVGDTEFSFPAIIRLDQVGLTEEVVTRPKARSLPKNDVSVSKFFSYAVEQDGQAYGYYYSPSRPLLSSDLGKNPLLVMLHGGPTAAAYAGFSLRKQFWTSRGFALFDVDYHGSIGYGRKFRDSLYGRWGEVDAKDTVAGIAHLIENELVDRHRVFVTGGSAGGYLVQRLLTSFGDSFAGGASYYGIGDLFCLFETTHKFESRYIENLLGCDPKRDSDLVRERSPFFNLDKLQSPLILFHGAEDKVVPPELSRQVYDALVEKGITTEYHEYSIESHGFRDKVNLVDSLEKEYSFYLNIMEKEK